MVRRGGMNDFQISYLWGNKKIFGFESNSK